MDEGHENRKRQSSLITAAVEAIRRGDATEGYRLLPVLRDARVDLEWLQRYERMLSIVHYEWPGLREVVELGQRRECPEESQIDLVTFYSDLPNDLVLSHRQSSGCSVGLWCQAATRIAPSARRVLLWGNPADPPPHIGVHEVMRVRVNPSELMFDRMRAYSSYLHTRNPGRFSVLMDNDVVCNSGVAQAFARDFDVGLTVRCDSIAAPINGGIILVASGAAGHSFLERTLACYRALSQCPDIHKVHGGRLTAWWGDQFALHVSVGQRALREHKSVRLEGVNIALLPCDSYNYSPRSPRDVRSQEKFFVHFKGSRKAWMATYIEWATNGLDAASSPSSSGSLRPRS
jgi:hypothetical protein